MPVTINPMPSEIPGAIPFDRDTAVRTGGGGEGVDDGRFDLDRVDALGRRDDRVVAAVDQERLGLERAQIAPAEIEGAEIGADAILDLEGDTIVVGAPQDVDYMGYPIGAAYVYQRNGTTWTLQQRLTPSFWATGTVERLALRAPRVLPAID